MIGDFEVKGIWWLPNNPENRLPGVLTFSPNSGGISLELHGSLSTAMQPQDLLITECVLGETYRGDPVTVCDCFETESNGMSSRIVGNHIFMGKHFDSRQKIKFSKIRVSYEHLEQWIGGRRFETETTKPYSAIHTPPQCFEIHLPSIDASIELTYSVSFSNGTQILEWKHTDYLELCPKVQQDYEWFTKNIYTLHLFLVLVTGGMIRQNEMVGYGDIIGEVSGTQVREKIAIHRVPTNDNSVKLDDWHILLKLPTLKDNIDVYVDKWFRDAALLTPIYALLWSIISRHSTYYETIFLNLTQALEAFHRRCYNGFYLPEDQYESIRNILVKAIPNGISDGLRDSLKSRLKYGNEISFRNRLKNLLDGSAWNDCLKSFIKDKSGFVNSVVDTRNYFVHYDRSLEDKALKPSNGLYHCNELLTLILFVLLYQNIGIPLDIVFNSVSERGRFLPYLLTKRQHYYGNSIDYLAF